MTEGNACVPPLFLVILSERSESKDPLSMVKQKSGAVRMDGPAYGWVVRNYATFAVRTC